MLAEQTRFVAPPNTKPGRFTCKRCAGFVKDGSDHYGAYRICLSCGWMQDVAAAEPHMSTMKSMPRLPQRGVWKAFFRYEGRYHQPPRRCQWPECSEEREFGKETPILCRQHQGAYHMAFGQPAPSWSEMRLRLPYGMVEIEYWLGQEAKNRHIAYCSGVRWPQPHAEERRIKQVISSFRSNTGYSLKWFRDALDTVGISMPESSRKSVGGI